MTQSTFPPITEVERISALPDPVLRNLQITQCYYELALAMMERTGWSANWCTFASWASKQAGQTIRKEDLGRVLETTLGSEAAVLHAAQDLKAAVELLGVILKVEEILALIWKAYDPKEILDRSSVAVARGNLKVFAEIAREFARFLHDCLPNQIYDKETIEGFTAQLRPGDPPEGQNYLRQAFLHYYQALFEENEKERIELMLLANMEIGYHEQIRLQPEINEALNAPVILPQVFARNLLKAIRPGGGWITELVWFVLRLFGRLREFDAAIEALVALAKRQVQYLVTETMMTIEFPHHNRLRLGDDLEVKFPPALQHISNPELNVLLSRIDPTPDSTRESGAKMWGDLGERIHFIADMFRCYEVSLEMREPPFSIEQTEMIKAGRIPPGHL